MTKRILFLTGHLARPRLERLLHGIGDAGFSWQVLDVGVKVAALMTEPILLRRLPRPLEADRVVFPGRAGLEPEPLSAAFNVPFERGPDEIADLPAWLGRGGQQPDLSRHDTRIFAEIVDAPSLNADTLLERARAMRADGADVIDLGCKPGIAFPALEKCVRLLRSEGIPVSVDSGDPAELRRGAEAGADFLLSLTERTLEVAEGTCAVPVLIPAAHGDVPSLVRAAEKLHERGRPCLLDPILDPIQFGFTAALLRYAEIRRRLPEVEILMGTGNLTELTDADTSGITAILLGVCSELSIRNILVVQVSPHTRRTIAEHDFARRLMFAARADTSLPQGYGSGLLQVHDRRPFPQTAEDIDALAHEIRDANFRITTAPDGIHVYSSRMHEIAQDAMALFPKLGVEHDGAHAFYLGTELAKAEIAFRLGKRYVQDEALDWGCAVPRRAQAATRLAEAGHTLRTKGTASEKDTTGQ